MSESVRMCRIEDADQLCEIIRNELGYTDITADSVRGTTLITLIESTARVDGAALVTVSSQFKRTEAHEFYQKLGYEKTSFAFKKKFV